MKTGQMGITGLQCYSPSSFRHYTKSPFFLLLSSIKPYFAQTTGNTKAS